MEKFKALANLHKNDGKRTRCFTAGKEYTGIKIAGEDDEIVEFIDDQNERHQVSSDWIQYFERV